MILSSFRSSLLRRSSASLLAALLGATAMAFVAPASAAEPRGLRGRGAMVRQAPFAARALRAERPAAARAQPREAQAPAPQPAEPPPETRPIERTGRPGRLTPDERRALRQQINDAGREIYRAPQP
jgi:hypothetical protein